MAQIGRYHGGLVFLGNPDGALDRFSRIASATLEDYGHPVERQSVMNAHQARVVSNQYLVKLALDETCYTDDADSLDINALSDEAAGNLYQSGKPMHRLEISLYPVAPGQDEREISELMLVVMLYRMVDAYLALQIEWLDPGTVLSVEQFLGAFTHVSPRRVRGRQQVLTPTANRFTPVAEMEPDLAMHRDTILAHLPHGGKLGPIELNEEEVLALAFRTEPRPDEVDGLSSEEQPENDIRRLTAWGMTGMLVFMSGPVAASMAAVNLLKGEDFRLNTHVLALTGFVSMMHGSGALASMTSYLPI